MLQTREQLSALLPHGARHLIGLIARLGGVVELQCELERFVLIRTAGPQAGAGGHGARGHEQELANLGAELLPRFRRQVPHVGSLLPTARIVKHVEAPECRPTLLVSLLHPLGILHTIVEQELGGLHFVSEVLERFMRLQPR